MIRIRLTDAEARRLEQAFLQATDRELRDRLQIVRLAHRGRPHQDIAADLGTTPRTVQRWLNAYLDGGIGALRPRKARGHDPAIPAATWCRCGSRARAQQTSKRGNPARRSRCTRWFP